MYQLLFDRDFKKDISKLDKNIRERILNKIYELEIYPELGKHLIGIDIWSLRVGKYRVLYKMKRDKRQVLILVVEHRKRIYNKVP